MLVEPFQLVGVQVRYAQQGGELEVGIQRLGDLGGHAHAVGRDQLREGAGPDDAEAVGAAEPGEGLASVAVAAHDAQVAGLDFEAEGVRAAVPVDAAADVDDNVVAVSAAGQPVVGRYVRAVEDDDGERFFLARCGLGVEARAVGEDAAEQFGELGGVVGHQAALARAVVLGGVQGMRQPLEPFPVPEVAFVRAHRDAEFLGGVEDGELPQHRPDHGACRLVVPADPDACVAAQVEGDGLVGDRGVGPDEAAQGVRRQRLQVLDRLGLHGGDAHAEPLVADGDSDLGEVLVAGAPFPQPGRSHERTQRVRVGVAPGVRVALADDGLTDPPPVLRQVAEVVAAVPAEALLALPRRAHELADEHGERADQHHAADHVGEDAAAAPGTQEDQHHAGGGDGHGQVREQRGHAADPLGQDRRLL